MSSSRLTAFVLTLALSSSSATAVKRAIQDPGDVTPARARGTMVASPAFQKQLSEGATWRSFQSRNGAWRAIWNETTRTPHRAFGPSIALPGFAATSEGVDASVRRFIMANSALFDGVTQLSLVNARNVNNTWYVRYRQNVGGIQVLYEDWEFRVSSDGRLFMFGTDAKRPEGGVLTAPRIPASVAREAAHRGLTFETATDEVIEGPLYVIPVEREGGIVHRLAYEMTVRTKQPVGAWLTYVDAENGEVLLRRDRIRHNVGGTVTGMVHPNLASDSLTTLPLKDARVSVGGNIVFTNASGVYTSAATGSVGVSSGLRGRWIDVDRCIADICGPSDGIFGTTAINPATVNIAWANTNSTASERDCYYHVVKSHDHVKVLDPGLTAVDTDVKAFVDLNDLCNAYWDQTTLTLNFFAAGGTCPNTASIPDCVYHEYGHFVNDQLFFSNGAPGGMDNTPLHEALADLTAAFQTNNALIAEGFFGPGTELRDLTDFKRWPEDYNPGHAHDTSQILSGAMWELRQAIGLATTEHIGHFAKYGLPDDLNDGVSFSEYFIDVLVADDTDNNLQNGTPHFTQIVTAFNNHGIGTNYFIHILTNAPDQSSYGPYPVTATITYSGVIGALDPGSPTFYYSTNTSTGTSPYTPLPMFPTGNPDEYGVNVPGVTSGVVNYYIQASDVEGGLKTEPGGAPTVKTYKFLVGPAATILSRDMESDPAWTVGTPATGDSATTGVWIRADPVATQAQPENDHTVAGTLCWVTGNGPIGGGIGEADVDDGKTTLTTPSFNPFSTGFIRPVISYWRWFSNNAGDAGTEDPWRVEISNNGGTSWVPVENTLISDDSWSRTLFFISDFITPTTNMRMRFIASDKLNPSLVEAAVDDFVVYAFPPEVGVEPPVSVASLSLSNPMPNPFRLSTRLDYRLPVRGHVKLEVFDLQGRAVRTLVSDDQDPGEHSASWDGLDGTGRPVANGPYFVRLFQFGQRLTQGVVLLR